MRIYLACPAPPGSRKGNRVTALRWARVLRDLGHRAALGPADSFKPCDVLVALHARRSHAAVAAAVARVPRPRVVVALTGTDLYRDIHKDKRAEQSLEWADRLIVLQEQGAKELPERLRPKVRVIYQSVVPVAGRPGSDPNAFTVCVLGHLRAEKDPFRAALALRHLPRDSRIQVTHAGEALSPEMEKRARDLMARVPGYTWLGEVARARARRLLAGSNLLVVSSKMEGGANVVSEALADGVPVLASDIPGNVGMLGEDYPGYFPLGDTRRLAELLRRAETDPAFYRSLQRACARRASLVKPARERRAWKALLREFVG